MAIQNRTAGKSTPRRRDGTISIGAILLIGLIVNIGILFSAPVMRTVFINNAMRDANALLAAKQPAPALQQLERIYPWASHYPSLAFPVETLIFKCYLQAGDLEQAQRYARSLRDRNEGPDRDIAATLKPPMLWLESLPNTVYNSVQASSPQSLHFPADGKESVKAALAEINRSDLFTTMDPVDASPVPAVENHSEKTVVAIPPAEQPVALEPPAGSVSPSSPPQTAIVSEPPPSRPIAHAPSKEEIAKRQQQALVNQLRLTASSLTNQLASLRAQLAALDATPLTAAQQTAKNRYSLARQHYNQFIEANKAMVQAMDKASGPRRMELLDQLRVRRFQEVTYQKNLQDAKTAFEKAYPAIAQRRELEKQIQALSLQLQSIYETMRNTQRQANT